MKCLQFFQVILNSLHRYKIQLHISQTSSQGSVDLSSSFTYAFKETSFVTVTAYQNNQIAQLKINNNPFARGFRADGAHGCKKRSRRLDHAIDEFTQNYKRHKLINFDGSSDQSHKSKITKLCPFTGLNQNNEKISNHVLSEIDKNYFLRNNFIQCEDNDVYRIVQDIHEWCEYDQGYSSSSPTEDENCVNGEFFKFTFE